MSLRRMELIYIRRFYYDPRRKVMRATNSLEKLFNPLCTLNLYTVDVPIDVTTAPQLRNGPILEHPVYPSSLYV